LDSNSEVKRLSEINPLMEDDVEMYFEEVVLEYVDCVCLVLNGDQ
jgi:hypothetical protein